MSTNKTALRIEGYDVREQTQKKGIVDIVGIVGRKNETEWEPITPISDTILPPFPTEVFASWLREFVEAQAAETATPRDLASMLCLSACALCVAKTFIIDAGGWHEPLNLFTVTSMPPGTRKSAVFSSVTRPIEEFERRVNTDSAPGLAMAQMDMEILKARVDASRKEAANVKAGAQADKESEARDLAMKLAEMKLPVPLRLVADDCTPERVAGLLYEQGGRLAILSPEGGLFDMIAGKYSDKGANMLVYLQSHAGDTLRVDRVNRPAELIIHPALTVGLAVQPEVLRGLQQKQGFRGKGLLGRFLYALPQSNLGHRPIQTAVMPFRVVEAYREGIQRLLEMAPPQAAIGETPRPFCLAMESEASRLFILCRSEVEIKLRQGEELGEMTDWGGKLCGAIARIAGILHLAEYADPARRITPETMQKAISLVPYLIAHARAAYSEMGMSEETDRYRAILDWIKRKDIARFRKREAHNAMQSRFPRAADMDKALEILCERNYTRLAPPETKVDGGAKKGEIYEVNPNYNTYNTYNTGTWTSTEDQKIKSGEVAQSDLDALADTHLLAEYKFTDADAPAKIAPPPPRPPYIRFNEFPEGLPLEVIGEAPSDDDNAPFIDE